MDTDDFPQKNRPMRDIFLGKLHKLPSQLGWSGRINHQPSSGPARTNVSAPTASTPSARALQMVFDAPGICPGLSARCVLGPIIRSRRPVWRLHAVGTCSGPMPFCTSGFPRRRRKIRLWTGRRWPDRHFHDGQPLPEGDLFRKPMFHCPAHYGHGN